MTIRFCATNKQNYNIAPQDSVSCDKGDYGCQGGYLDKAWAYAASTGLVTEE